MPGNRNLLTRHVITKNVNLQGNNAIYFHETRLIYFKAVFFKFKFFRTKTIYVQVGKNFYIFNNVVNKKVNGISKVF